jgi:hypothetical protein
MKIAGAGMRNRPLIRLDNSANDTTAAARSSASPNGSTSVNTAQASRTAETTPSPPERYAAAASRIS